MPDIHATGDCLETWHRLLRRSTYLPLGTTVPKHEHIAGELVTQAVKIFDLVMARTGVPDGEVAHADLPPHLRDSHLGSMVYYLGSRVVRI